jgi:hypothetical protein
MARISKQEETAYIIPMRIEHEKTLIYVGAVSMVGVPNGPYPIPYGNYFSIRYNYEFIHVNNMCYENYMEAVKQFLKTDNKIDVLIFSDYKKDNKSISIVDKRIPKKWFSLWDFEKGYCNGGLTKEAHDLVKYNIGDRFSGGLGD